LELNASPEKLDEIEAHLALIRERIENIARMHRGRVRDRVFASIDVEANVEENIETTIRGENFVWGETNLENLYQKQLERFDNLYAEVLVMLAGAPGNTHGKHAAERLTEKAVELKDRAVEAYENGRIRGALGLIHAANRLLSNSKMILEHASRWEAEHAVQWEQWKEQWENMENLWKEHWENMRQQLEEQGWENMENLWKERWENMRKGYWENRD